MSDENENPPSSAPEGVSPVRARPHGVLVVGDSASDDLRRMAVAAAAREGMDVAVVPQRMVDTAARSDVVAMTDPKIDLPPILDATGLEETSDEELERASAAEDEEARLKKVRKRKSDPNRQMLPVRPQDAWKFSKSSHPRCNGKGYVIVDEHDKEALALKVDVLDGKGEPTGEKKIEYRHTCQCAVTGIKRENPDLVTINGHLFWPPKSKEETVAVADPDASESPMDVQMRLAKEADRERKLARVTDLRKEAVEAEAAAAKIAEEIAVLCGPEQKQLTDLHEGDEFLRLSLGSLADDNVKRAEEARSLSGQILDHHTAVEQEIAKIRRRADEAIERLIVGRTEQRVVNEKKQKDIEANIVTCDAEQVRVRSERDGLKKQIAAVESEITKKAGRLRRKQGEKVRLASQLRVRAQRIEERNKGGE